jgi:hypothetical protein
LINDLSRVFKNGKVDLSDLTHADPLFLCAATQKSKLLSGNEKDYDRLMLMAFKKYSDYMSCLKMEKEFVEKKLKTYVTT